MPIMPAYAQPTAIYYHKTTTNQSFLNMHYYLRDKGIQNNAFFLVLFDPDLARVDPRNEMNSVIIKNKILRECMYNYWYFIREIVRIPDQGGQVGSGKKYELHRGNLAMNFGFIRNWNMFVEFPRQNYKTVSAVARYLWTFNFGTSNSEFMFINKKHDDSKLNLARLKELRASLPTFLQMAQNHSEMGRKLKAENSVETLQHISNGNKIKTLASARNKVMANSLGRGMTMPIQWYDEPAFTPHIGIVYSSATPAFNTAAINARNNRAPHGILFTTTPGDMTTEEGMYTFNIKEMATKFDEGMYDMTDEFLNNLIRKNTDSNFVYIRYTYQQLGRTEEWFRDICILMMKDWTAIRREVLLEWSKASDNSPFRKEDLIKVKSLIKQPIRTIMLATYFQMEIYMDMDLRFPPIVGVDVSGGYNKDSSCITVIDSKSTAVSACLNCNYISTIDLTSAIYELVTKYMPRAIVNVERNGGFGASVIGNLMKTSIKSNLYYEIKDRVIEERSVNGHVLKSTTKTKVYGLDSSKTVRDKLMEILRDRMEHHKDKFISPIIHSELEGLEVKKSGKIEHSSNSHDDQIFSYLMALYVWYEGENLMERFGIEKSAIKTDENMEEAIVAFEDKYMVDIASELDTMTSDIVQEQLEILNKNQVSTYQQFLDAEHEKDQAALEELKRTKIGRDAIARAHGMNANDINTGGGMYKIPDNIFDDFYN